MVVIAGKSGSGKTTLANALVAIGYKKVVTYTTRKPRSGEKNGIHYHFVTDAEFDKLEREGKFIETAGYAGNRYGSPKDAEGDGIIILEPQGVMSLKKAKIPFKVIYMEGCQNILKERMTKRGDDPEKIKRRLSNDDDPLFDEVKEMADVILIQDEDTLVIDNIYHCKSVLPPLP